jgi:hypothetical protein
VLYIKIKIDYFYKITTNKYKINIESIEMKIYTNIVNPLMFGTWILRVTNDVTIEKAINYIQIQEVPIIKFKTLKHEGLLGIKKSRTATIKNTNYINDHCYTFSLNYSRKNVYSYSFLGIEIPEVKSSSTSYNKVKNLTIKLFEKTIIISDNDSYLYYIFDLYIGKIKYPNTETTIYTFIFTQLFSIFVGVIITHLW